MAKKSHVSPRDGSAGLGGPRPPVAPRPSRTHEAPPAPKAFAGSYSDLSTVGQFEVDRATFEGLKGEPNPGQLGQRGETIVPKGKTADAGGGIEIPAPLD
jgi:hypothetical protein